MTDEIRNKISKTIKNKYGEMLRELKTGKNNPNWKGGITPINILLKMTSAYRDWRNSVFTRDDYTCQECGVKGGYLQVHHIKNFSNYPKLRFIIDNGITLCKDCHKKTDSYGVKGNYCKLAYE